MTPRKVLVAAFHAVLLYETHSFSWTRPCLIGEREWCPSAGKLGLKTYGLQSMQRVTTCKLSRHRAASAGSRGTNMLFDFPNVPWASSNGVQYFAFGSNMNPAVLRGMRQVEPLEENPGFVKGYRLAFNMMGTPGIEPSFASAEISSDANDELHGVLYNLTWGDWLKVAATEGVPFGYSAESVRVSLYDGSVVEAVTLSTGRLARTPFNIDVPPSPRYRELLIEGARIHNVSEAYCQKLEQIQPNPFILVDTRESYARRRKARGW